MRFWTKQDYIDNYPATPEGPHGALVDEGEVLRAMSEWEAKMQACVCDWDLDDNGRGYNTPPLTGCPVHPTEETDDVN